MDKGRRVSRGVAGRCAGKTTTEERGEALVAVGPQGVAGARP